MFSSTYPPRNVSDLFDDVRRVVLGTAYALRPRRIAVLPRVTAAVVRGVVSTTPTYPAFLREGAPQPDSVHGFVGLCGSMSTRELMAGFRRGYYPTSHIGRKKWWLHEARMVMPPHEMVREKDVRRLLRNKRLAVTFDTAFAEVMCACAEPRRGQASLTWITPDITDAYIQLHREGFAHSFEAWDAEGNLVGGGFGIAVGPVFVIESQFTAKRNASKVAMAMLLRHLTEWNFTLVDAKGFTPHLERLGFRPMPHEDYLNVLQCSQQDFGHFGTWTVDDSLDASKDWGPAKAPPRAELSPQSRLITESARAA